MRDIGDDGGNEPNPVTTTSVALVTTSETTHADISEEIGADSEANLGVESREKRDSDVCEHTGCGIQCLSLEACLEALKAASRHLNAPDDASEELPEHEHLQLLPAPFDLGTSSPEDPEPLQFYVERCSQLKLPLNCGVVSALRYGLPVVAPTEPFGDEDMLSLGDVFCHCNALSNVRELVFSQCCLTHVGMLSLAHIFINSVCQITSLDLSNNAIGIEGIKLLAEACLRNPTSAHVVGFESLVSLNLANTTVGLRSAIFLSQMLTSGKLGQLQSLNLANNYLGMQGKSVVLQAIQARSVLSEHKPLEANLHRNEVVTEVLNGLTHGSGVIFGIGAIPVMLAKASDCGGRERAAIMGYLLALIIMFASSTLYHSFYCLDTAMKVFRILDKSAIYFLIAGTYTPLLVLSFPNKPLYSTGLLVVLWVIAACGVLLEAMCKWRYKDWLAIGLYVTMGWAALACVYDLFNHLDSYGFTWMVAGGMAYMFGIPFYVVQDPEYFHVIWHMWVILGAVIHWYFILEFVIPKAIHCQA